MRITLIQFRIYITPRENPIPASFPYSPWEPRIFLSVWIHPVWALPIMECTLAFCVCFLIKTFCVYECLPCTYVCALCTCLDACMYALCTCLDAHVSALCTCSACTYVHCVHALPAHVCALCTCLDACMCALCTCLACICVTLYMPGCMYVHCVHALPAHTCVCTVYILVCTYVWTMYMPGCMCVCTLYTCLVTEEGADSHGNVVVDRCGLPCGCKSRKCP